MDRDKKAKLRVAVRKKAEKQIDKRLAMRGASTKKLPRAFDEWRVTKPAHELDLPKDWKYLENPLYWHTFGQYQQYPQPRDPKDRLFYRAVIGYDALWDKDLDKVLTDSLGWYLINLMEDERYYFKRLKLAEKETEVIMPGVPWLSEIKPGIKEDCYTANIKFRPKDRIIARFNLLDWPNHVDLELEGHPGERTSVSTVSFKTWQAHQHRFRGA